MAKSDELITITLRQSQVLRFKSAGFSDKDIATRLGVCERTIERDWKELKQLMGDGIDITAERKEQRLYSGLAKRSLIKNLGKNNTAMTIAYFKGNGIWQDHVKDDTNPDLTPDELADLIKQVAGASPGEQPGPVPEADQSGS